MICLRRYVVVGEMVTLARVILKWDDNTDFGFDITNNKMWRQKLKKMIIKGKKLPRKYRGLPLAYNVYMWGSGLKYVNLYPGFKGAQKLDVNKYGRLDIDYDNFWGI